MSYIAHIFCVEYRCYTKDKNDALYICRIIFFAASPADKVPIYACVCWHIVFKHEYDISILIRITLR